ncbi:MAG: hypothetical protein PHX68_01100 [Alphaproteobacteria bacterium]|nr:hypothetical protein [Alphaproteobacteria bacterium]
MLLQLFVNTLIVGSGYGLIALAFRLMYSVSPFFNLTLGSLIAVGSYATFYLFPTLGVWAMVPVVALVAVLA